MSVVEELDAACRQVERLVAPSDAFDPPTVGVVLGSGLGAWADGLDGLRKVPYAEIPGMPRPAVHGHPGNLCLGSVDGVRVACLQGRVHLYEGHPIDRVVFGVRLLARLGCRVVVLTNAAGGLHPDYAPGDFMLIVDHLNLTGRNPLVGPNEEALGTRFPDMTHTYDRRIRKLAHEAAAETRTKLHEGVYASLLGPSYETPAEIRMVRSFGADAVGMSTVPEVIALRHMRVRVGAISCITNLAAGLSAGELSHAEVEQTAKDSRARFVALLTEWVRRIGTMLAGPPSSTGQAPSAAGSA